VAVVLAAVASAVPARGQDSLVGTWELSGTKITYNIVRSGAGYKVLETTDRIDAFGHCKVRKGDAFMTFEPVGQKYRVTKLVYSYDASNPPGDRGDRCVREPRPEGVMTIVVKGKALRIQCESNPALTCYSFTRVGAADTVKPTVRALPSSGKAGGRVKLLFRSSDDSERARIEVVVLRGAKMIEKGSTNMSFVGYKLDVIDSLVWYPPASLKGRFRFCLTAIDPAGNRSARSCSSVVLR
jgi:hypothetical protein